MLLGTWVSVVTAVLLIVPGAIVGRRMTLPWPVAIAAAPPLTFGIVSLFTVVYGAIGFEWNLVTALIAVIISFAAAWLYAAALATRWGLRLAPAPSGITTSADGRLDSPFGRVAALRVGAGVALGAVIIAITCIRPIVKTTFAGLNTVPQVWDSLWHASSLRWIADTGRGSSLRMGELMNYDTHGFNYYPNAWHALGALTMPITGANAVETYNTYSPATAAITITFGVASLGYWLARRRLAPPTAALVAGTGAALAALFGSLPYVEVDLTSVPNAVGVSIAPIAAVL
ncbi:MAG: hypothetical protein QM673_17815, partial [Gordonia sp. (in: high G+C Gram-positive bacteria)]